MRSSLIFAAPFAALAVAQSSAAANETVEVSSSSSSYIYTNPLTSYLTETNSVGIITGMPPVATSLGNAGTAITTQPQVVTSQPAADLVPAGFTGVTTYLIGGNGTSATSSIIVTADSSTTFLVSATPATASASGSGSASGSSGSKSSGSSGSATSGGASSGSATGSAATTSSSTGAAAHIYGASSALIGAGAVFAAFL